MSLFDKVNGQMTIQQIQNDPIGIAKQRGYDIPPSLSGNPQAMVQHLIQTGQVTNPMLQKILPLMQRLGIK